MARAVKIQEEKRGKREKKRKKGKKEKNGEEKKRKKNKRERKFFLQDDVKSILNTVSRRSAKRERRANGREGKF